MRDAYNRPLSAEEQKQLEVDPSYFAEITSCAPTDPARGG